jgi:abequosyltransferase
MPGVLLQSTASMNTPKLSICIPTYNFGGFIGATLESIICQLPRDAEIVVLDGGSTDQTPEVVAGIQVHCRQLHYHRLPARGGIDRDMARTVGLANGDYCWLFSSDDIMRPKAIERLMRALASGSDIYLCKHASCDLDMKLTGQIDVLDVSSESDFELADESQRRRYFGLAQTTEAFFSFMGGIVIQRAKWNSVALNETFVGSCWAHVARIFELIPGGLRVTYLPEHLLDRRGGNDSFSDRGVVNRYRIAIEGYHRLAEFFFGPESPEAFHIRRVLRAEFHFKTFLYGAVLCRRNPEGESFALLRELVRKTHADAPLRGRVVWWVCCAFPSRVYPKMRDFYRRMRTSLTASG